MKISWWRDGERVEGEGDLLQVSDTSVYTCQVETRLDSSQAGPAEVMVYEPTVVRGPAMLETVAGQPAIMQCQATLDPGLVDGALWEWTRYLTYFVSSPTSGGQGRRLSGEPDGARAGDCCSQPRGCWGLQAGTAH